MKTSTIIILFLLFIGCSNEKNTIKQFLVKEKYTPSEMPSPLWYQAELRFVIDSMKTLVNRSYWEGFDKGQNDSFCPPPFVYGYIKLDSGHVIGSFNMQYKDHSGKIRQIIHFIIYWDGDKAEMRTATPDEIKQYGIKPKNGAEVYVPKLYPITS